MPDRTPVDCGSRLREARERRGLTLRQISSATKISIAVLEALERGDTSRLPGGIFSRGFVRSYALEVGLDPDAMVHHFIAEGPGSQSMTAGHSAIEDVEDREAHESEERMAWTLLRLALISVPLAGVVLYWSAAGGKRTETIDAPMPTQPTAETVTARTASPEELPEPIVAVEPAAPPQPAPEPSADRLTVTLAAVRPCWVSATVDGQQVLERLLVAGEREEVEARQDLVLTIGDASAMTLMLNGREARGLGGSGEVVTLRLNPDNYTEYLAIQ